ncbi:MAG TPA: tRNA (adenosine(37)-N6)-threonylcarbamoyltransferase complex ATPase subunit type 1 TsaE [Paracoccaceae bacterium]|nr:tRNA (adenosine(37)-N6)-threonylcarbamoyltransferase complex ATPase subunit type 1 TsaE [Paracoccaceae bacterium]
MNEGTADGGKIGFHLPSPEATEALAQAIAPGLDAGDTLLLSGPLGVGKTAFARALIAERLRRVGRSESVPSPSYTLVQTYSLGEVELWHADLYRLGDASELGELGLDDAFRTAIVLVEWPERLGQAALPRALRMNFLFREDGEARGVEITSSGTGWEWLHAALADLSAKGWTTA